MKCWCTMPMPAVMASPGPAKCWTASSSRISPSSAWYRPYSTFISVDLPAPFSPRRQWISPGSTVRSMWSLATRAPKRLVMPRSSSFMGPIYFRCAVPARGCRRDSRREAGGPEQLGPDPPPRALRSILVDAATDGDSTVIEPSMMPALMVSSSPCSAGETFDSKSWNGAMPTPSFSSVPTYGVGVEVVGAGVGDDVVDAGLDALEDRGQVQVADRRGRSRTGRRRHRSSRSPCRSRGWPRAALEDRAADRAG